MEMIQLDVGESSQAIDRRQPIRSRFSGPLTAMLAVCVVATATAQPARRDGPLPSPVDGKLVAKLQSPYRVAVAGKPLRELLQNIADAGDFNLCFDRRLAPDQPVAISADAKTVFQAISEAAAAADAEWVAIDRVVIVGRPAWVQTVAGAILSLPGGQTDTPATRRVEQIAWPRAATANQAFAAVLESLGDRPDPESLRLPHDLWPATRWRGLSPRLAALLVTAQFDRMPSPSATAKLSSRVPLKSPSSLAVLYPSGRHSGDLKRAALAADPGMWIKGSRVPGTLLLTGSPAAHTAAIRAMIAKTDPAADNVVDLDSVRFTLQLRSTPAANVFEQLAMAGGRTLAIDEAAVRACQKRVSLEVHDLSLRELATRIAEEVGVVTDWGVAELRVALP